MALIGTYGLVKRNRPRFVADRRIFTRYWVDRYRAILRLLGARTASTISALLLSAIYVEGSSDLDFNWLSGPSPLQTTLYDVRDLARHGKQVATGTA
jgi:hypothetical protein